MRTVYPFLVAAAFALSCSAAAIDQLASEDHITDCDTCVDSGAAHGEPYAKINKRQSDFNDGVSGNTNTGNTNANGNSGIQPINPADLDVNYDGGSANTGAGNSNVNNNNNNNNGLQPIDPASLGVDYGDGYDFPDTQRSPGSANQPVNRPMNQPMNQPINQPNNQPGLRSIPQPANQPGIQPINQPNTQPNNQPVNRPVNRPFNQPFNQPVNRPVNQPVNQPMNQPVNQPNTQFPGTRPRPTVPNRGNRPYRESPLRDVTERIDERTPPVSTSGQPRSGNGYPNTPPYNRNAPFPGTSRPDIQLVDGQPSPQNPNPNGNPRMPFPGNPNNDRMPPPGQAEPGTEFGDGTGRGFDPGNNRMPPQGQPGSGTEFGDGHSQPGDEGFPGSAHPDSDFEDGTARDDRGQPNIPFDNKDFSSGDPGYHNHPKPLDDPRQSRDRPGAACRKRNPPRDHDHDFDDPVSDDKYDESYCDGSLSDDDLPFEDGCNVDGYFPDRSPCRPDNVPSNVCESDLYSSDDSKTPELIELCEARRHVRDYCEPNDTSYDGVTPVPLCDKLQHELEARFSCYLDRSSSDERHPTGSCNRDPYVGDEASCLTCDSDSVDVETRLKINIFLNGNRSPKSHRQDSPYSPGGEFPHDTVTSPDGNDFEYEFPSGGPVPFKNDRQSSPGMPGNTGFDDGTVSPAGIPNNRNSPSPQGQRPQTYNNDGLSSIGVPDDSPYNDGSMSSIGVPNDGSYPSSGNQRSSPAPRPYNQSPPMSNGGSRPAPQPSYRPNSSPSSSGGGYVHTGQTPAQGSNTPFGHPSGRMSGKRKCRARYKVKSRGGERPDFPGHHPGAPSGGSGGSGQCGVVSRETIALLKKEEGFVATVTADPRGHGTIGYGHKCIQSGCSEVPYSQPLSEADGEKLMMEDLEVCLFFFFFLGFPSFRLIWKS